MAESYRDRMRQAQWIKREAKRQIAREQAEALTALGVACCQREGWVALLDPDGLAVRLKVLAVVEAAMRNLAASAERLTDFAATLPADVLARLTANPPVVIPTTDPQMPAAEATRGHSSPVGALAGDWTPESESGSDRRTGPEVGQ